MSDQMREWRVSQSGNPNKAWIICAGKKISPLMTLVAAKQLAKLHNTELHYEVLAAYREQASLASKPQVTEGEIAEEVGVFIVEALQLIKKGTPIEDMCDPLGLAAARALMQKLDMRWK